MGESSHLPVTTSEPSSNQSSMPEPGLSGPMSKLQGLDASEQTMSLSPEAAPGYAAQAKALVPSEASTLKLDSFGTWVQSGLNQVDRTTPFLSKKLAVDGQIGRNTKQAVRAFQAQVPSIVPAVLQIARSGALDGTTVWALEQATASKNPAGRPSTPPATESAAPPVAGADKKDAAASSDDAPAPVGDESVAAGAVKKEISATGASNAAVVAKAYGELRKWTDDRWADDGDKDVKRAKGNLAKKYAKAVASATKHNKAVPVEADFFKKGFFGEYWMLHCDQFANELSKRINGPNFPTLSGLRGKTNGAVDKAAAEGKSGPVAVAGRDLTHRGKTMAELDKALGSEGAEAGIGVHVKLRPEVDRPYDPSVKDELHHWFVHIGNGKFADSFSASQAGSAADGFLGGWVTSKFHNKGRPGEVFNYGQFHTPEYADAASLDRLRTLEAEVEAAMAAKDKKAQHKAERTIAKERLPRPKANLLPRVTALYRPADAKKSSGAAKKG